MASKPNPVLKLQLGKELSVENCFLEFNTYLLIVRIITITIVWILNGHVKIY